MTDNDKTSGLNRRTFIKLGGCFALLGLPALRQIASAKPLTDSERPKNILFLITDQQHIEAMSAAGCPYLSTPAMDRIVQSGTSFSESYCPYPVCVPSRAAIFSGRMPSESRDENRAIAEGMPNLGEWIRRHGEGNPFYLNRWHLPRGYTKMIPGFEVLTTGLGGIGYITDPPAARAAEAWLYQNPADEPFFMVASFMQPHDICEWLRLNTYNQTELRYPEIADDLPPLPENFEYDSREPDRVRQMRLQNEPAEGTRYDAPGRWDETYWRYYMWNYYRHVEMIDAEIERILRAIELTGRLEDTLIVFTSDHGEGLGHHQTVRKGQAYDESAKVPLVFSWPGHIASGQVDSTLVSGIDIAPTLCDFLGIPPQPEARGRSLRDLLTAGSSLEREFVVVEFAGGQGRALRTKDYKYVVVQGNHQRQLFDMRKDPGETRNLADDPLYAPVVAHHRELLNRWESGLEPYNGEHFVDRAT